MTALIPARAPLVQLLRLGAVLGFLVLGIGGRIAMRVIALRTGAPADFSLGGTTTVLLAGTASGVGGVALFLFARAACVLFRPHVRGDHPWLQHLLFGALLLWVSLRGLHPVQPLAASLFLPLVLVYALLFIRGANRHLSAAPTQALLPA